MAYKKSGHPFIKAIEVNFRFMIVNSSINTFGYMFYGHTHTHTRNCYLRLHFCVCRRCRLARVNNFRLLISYSIWIVFRHVGPQVKCSAFSIGHSYAHVSDFRWLQKLQSYSYDAGVYRRYGCEYRYLFHKYRWSTVNVLCALLNLYTYIFYSI